MRASDALTGRGWDPSDLTWVALGAGCGLLGSALVLVAPLGALCAALLVLFIALAVTRPIPIRHVATVGLLAGAMTFGYGFANLGINVGVPIPLAQVLLVLLATVALGTRRTLLPTAVWVPSTLLITLVGIRMVADYPTFGVLAIRDATIAIDLLAVLVGFYAFRNSGLDKWLKVLDRLFLLVLIYGSLRPFQEALTSNSPAVGLQQSVPLLGQFQGIGVGAGAALLFFAVYRTGPTRVLLVAWALGVIGLTQARGLYLAVPLGALIVLLTMRRRSPRLLLTLAAALVVCIALLAFVAPLNLKGRLGDVDPSFYASHLRTLLGDRGVGSGSIDHRIQWAERTFDEVFASPQSTLFGVGLGFDLAFGFQAGGSSAVRKPHNDFLEVFARLGLVGALIFLSLLTGLLRNTFSSTRSADHREATFASWVLGTSAIYLLVAATQPLLAYAFGSFPLFMLLGMGAALTSAADGHRANIVSRTDCSVSLGNRH